jgi:hypothetical protein
LRVLFSHGGSADDVIEELIRADPSPGALTVVSDDHRLQQAARRRGCDVSGCLDYYDAGGAGRAPRAAPPEGAGKPESSTPDELERYLKAFGECDDDPLLRDPY